MTRHGLQFPDPETADSRGLVAVTHALSPELLLAAYSQGIFPWTDNPVGWFSPDPRAIFVRDRIHLPSNLPKLVRRARLRVTYDQAFTAVMEACRGAHADDGEWITDRFVAAYAGLHALGHAHSVEVWQDDALVGGLYGVQVRGLFAGESMFYKVPNASKAAFAALLAQLDAIGTCLMDAQVLNAHTAKLGAVQIRRRDYLKLLGQALATRCLYEGSKWPASGALKI
jgi:leucyl/phenylalanyl-tRNA--protein transferase